MDSRIMQRTRKQGDKIEREQMQANLERDYGGDRPAPQEQKENLADLILKQRDEITTLRQRVKDCQGAIERREQIISETETRSESEIAAFQAVAVLICQQEADEWDSDRLQTYKNYAQACGRRIAKLTPIDVQAWLLRRQSEAVEAISEYLKLRCRQDFRKWVKPATRELDREAQRLRNEAKKITQEG